MGKGINVKAVFFLSIIVSLIFASSFQNISAELGYFEKQPIKELYQQPTVCIFQTSDIRVNEKTWNRWYSEAKNAIDEWETILKSRTSTSIANWDIEVIEIPLDKQSSYNSAGCDIKIYFTNRPPPEKPSWLGWYAWGTGDIHILYLQKEFCGKKYVAEYGVYFNTYCFRDDLERPKKMAAVLKHELGHAFGLRHFVTDDPKVVKEWQEHPLGQPSIMSFIHHNEEQMKIQLIDVKKIFEVYGATGFSKNKNTNPVFFDEQKEFQPKIFVPTSPSNTKIFASQPSGKIFTGDQVTISGYLGKSVSSKARLATDFEPVSDANVNFSILGKYLGSAKTNSYGRFTFSLMAPTITCENCAKQDIHLSARFDGDYYLSSSASPIIIPVYEKEHPINSGILESEFKNPTDRVTVTFATVQNAFDKSLEDHSVNDNLQIKTNLKNNQNQEQSFAYVVIIKDERGTGVFMESAVGTLPAKATITTFVTWKPTQSGSYTIERTIWESVDNPILISSSIKSELKIWEFSSEELMSKSYVVETKYELLLIDLNNIKNSLDKIQKKIDTLYDSIKKAENLNKSSEAKSHIAKAWKEYNKSWNRFQIIKDWANELPTKYSDLLQKQGTDQKKYYESLRQEFSSFEKEHLIGFEEQLEHVSQELEYANNTEKQTCFLFWCW